MSKNWPRLISDLEQAGMTVAAIARHCGRPTSTLSDLKHGFSKQPYFDTGEKLVALHAEVCLAAKKAVSRIARKRTRKAA